MIYTTRIKAAIRFAIKTHDVYQQQRRKWKGRGIAYITHPMTVALILSQADATEDVVIAGILHDTVEDSVPQKKVTVAMIRERFGPRVAALVDSVTEHHKNDPWEKRKREAIEHIASFTHGSVLVKSADVLSNGRELLDVHAREGRAVWRRFSRPKPMILDNFQQVIAALLHRWPKNPLSGDLRSLRRDLKSIQ